jgi:hypothetical protein
VGERRERMKSCFSCCVGRDLPRQCGERPFRDAERTLGRTCSLGYMPGCSSRFLREPLHYLVSEVPRMETCWMWFTKQCALSTWVLLQEVLPLPYPRYPRTHSTSPYTHTQVTSVGFLVGMCHIASHPLWLWSIT